MFLGDFRDLEILRFVFVGLLPPAPVGAIAFSRGRKPTEKISYVSQAPTGATAAIAA